MDPDTEESRRRFREGNAASLVAALIFLVLLIAGVVIAVASAPIFRMATPEPVPSDPGAKAE
jgi:hypothetical protein